MQRVKSKGQRAKGEEQRAKSGGQRAKGKGQRAKSIKQGARSGRLDALCSTPQALCSLLLALSPMLFALCPVLFALCFLHGCSPPSDYYQQVLEMEEYGEQNRRDTGRRPGEIVAPAGDPEPIAVAKPPVTQLSQDVPQEEVRETSVVEQQKEEIEERPPQREAVGKPSPSLTQLPEPVSIASDVIKNALNAEDLGVDARSVELVNGRLSGGRNSVRVNFRSESLDVINDRFVAICAVIYHLNSQKNTVDVIVGIAEDERANLLAIVQTNMSDVAAWMSNEISRAEWFSRVTKRML